MEINQNRINRISKRLDEKYLYWFIKNYVTYGEESLKKLKGKKILYLPNHLSHFDYILLPFILNKNKLPHPAIIAGKNLEVWPTNKLFSRETGAVFVDRKKIEIGNLAQKKEELRNIKRNITELVYNEHDLLVFLDGTRKNPEKVMDSPKERYPREYLFQILNQNKNFDEYVGINLAINYKPHTIEKPFLELVRFFKKKFFPAYFGIDILAFLTQPIRKKPTAYVNFGEPYPLNEFIEKRNSKGLVEFVKKDTKRLFREIN